MDHYILVENVRPETGKTQPAIKVLRSFLSEERALEDLELLSDTNEQGSYSVFKIQHIDT
jgi:hypothetical protein